MVALVAVRGMSELTGRGKKYWHLDLRTLYREQTSFYRGDYPHAAVGSAHDRQLKLKSDYPPYAFPLFIPWLPPGLALKSAEIWFTLCQWAAACVVVGWAWRSGRGVSISAGVFIAAGVLAITGLRADLLFGNVALLTTAMLVGLQVAIDRERWWWAAAFWAGAMLKPQMGWAFALLFLHSRGWRPLATAVAVLVVLAFASCQWTGVDLAQALGGGVADSWSAILQVGDRYSLVTLLATAGVPAVVAIVGAAGIGAGVIGWKLRGDLESCAALQRFAFVALVNRICAYHNVCDDLLLTFPLVWLAQQAWTENRSGDWVALLALGASIWAPTVAFGLPGAKLCIVALWIAVATWISRGSRLAIISNPSLREAG